MCACTLYLVYLITKWVINIPYPTVPQGWNSVHFSLKSYPEDFRPILSYPGGALKKAFERKVQGAAEDCRQQGLACMPFALEALGGFHPVAIRQTKMLGAALARQKGQEEGETTRHLFQRISLTLARGNSTLLVSRCPVDDFLPGEVDGQH